MNVWTALAGSPTHQSTEKQLQRQCDVLDIACINSGEKKRRRQTLIININLCSKRQKHRLRMKERQ